MATTPKQKADPEQTLHTSLLDVPFLLSGASENPPLSGKKLHRACDYCRKRKVKCDSGSPCSPCRKYALRCTYDILPKKKGPKRVKSGAVVRHNFSGDDLELMNPYQMVSRGQRSFSSWVPQHPQETTVFHPRWDGNLQTYYEPVATNCEELATMLQTVALPQVRRATIQSTHADHNQRPSLVNSVPSTHQSHLTYQSNGTQQQSRLVAGFQQRQVSSDEFFPFIDLFYAYLFPIMPIVDRRIYFKRSLYSRAHLFSPDAYCFLCSICAATVVQLDESISRPPALRPNRENKDLFVEECLRERETFDYIDQRSTLSIMTSFFLFSYFGNLEIPTKAWHFLQESITLSENLSIDVEASYTKLHPVEAQWRRRLYWLLFITERAYAVQMRKNIRLHCDNVRLPTVLEGEDAEALSGFVNLAALFAVVSDDFVKAWRSPQQTEKWNKAWLASTQSAINQAALSTNFVHETQQVDIDVTRQWLHVLSWQLGVSKGLVSARGEGAMHLKYPVELARNVLQIIEVAKPIVMDSHGIGMEQKLSDISGCLADVLGCSVGDPSSTVAQGKWYLKLLLKRLSSMRGRESRYLKPLMSRVNKTIGFDINRFAVGFGPATSTLSSQTMRSRGLISPVSPPTQSGDIKEELSWNGDLGMSSIVEYQDPAEANNGCQISTKNTWLPITER